ALYTDIIEPYSEQIVLLDNKIKQIEYYTALSAYSHISDVTSHVSHKLMGLTDSFRCLESITEKYKLELASYNSIKTKIDSFFETDFIKKVTNK
uniref:hypothetical protein n=1 Tax=Salmonella sp. s51228 TaxID=3159652 RepID=UPI00397FDF32